MSIGAADSLRTKVAELLVVRASAHSCDAQRNFPLWELSNQQLQRLIGEGVGGVILFGGTSTELLHRTRTLQSWSNKPLLFCADVEEGLGQRFEGGTWLVPPMALGQIYKKDRNHSLRLAERYGMCTGRQARSCGLNWILAPVCDVNSNPKNPVINLRAWGEDPLVVSDLACAFIRGLDSQGVLSCAKHFPGHGDTGVDSHLDLPVLEHDISRLKEFEFRPFKDAITAGVNSVMTAHILLSEIDPENPATLSSAVLTGLLRHQLGFDGLVVTDALVMQAIAKSYGCAQASVMAFAAGADLILMPENPDQAIDAICQALNSGRVPFERLDNALERRRKAISKVEAVSLEQSEKASFPFNEGIESAQDDLFAEALIDASLKIRHSGGIQVNTAGINLVRVDSVLSCPILANSAPTICLPEEIGFQSLLCHPLGISPWQNDSDSPLALDRLGEGPLLIQLFMRGNPFRGDCDSNEPWAAALLQLQREGLLAGLVVYGSPYVCDQLFPLLEPSIPFAYSPGQMPEAQRKALSSLIQPDLSELPSDSEYTYKFTD